MAKYGTTRKRRRFAAEPIRVVSFNAVRLELVGLTAPLSVFIFASFTSVFIQQLRRRNPLIPGIV